MAGDLDVDLVEIAATAIPPVCRLMDYGKFKYQEQKKAQEAKSKQKVIEVKEIKFRVKIGTHDYETKLRHAEEFLDKGNKLKMTLQFRGRENAHKDLGMTMMQKIIMDLESMAHVDMPPKLVGRAIGMTLSPLTSAKRKRRFAKIEEEYVEDDDDHDEDESGESESSEETSAAEPAK